jgi:Flp pilus assembly pilin Flp
MTVAVSKARNKPVRDERGASMVEYILLVALIALAVIAAVVFLKDQVNGKFNESGSKLSNCGVVLPAGLNLAPVC